MTLSNDSAPIESVAVLGIDGRQLQMNGHFNSGESIDMSRYPSGIYLLAIRYASGNREVVKIKKG